MKGNLAFLFLAVASTALAQTPAAVEKPKPTTVSVVKASAKPAPGKAAPAHKATAAKPQPGAVSGAPAVKPAASQAKVNVAQAKPGATPQVKPVAAPSKPAVVAAPAAAHTAPVSKAAVATKPVAAPVAGKKTMAVGKPSPKTTKSGSKPAATVTVSSMPKVKSSGGQETKTAAKTERPKAMSAVGRRDPFTSPVVSMGPSGSGCSTGKRCLAIDQIALRGVVKSDSGMIAVVVNSMDKAYFLRENDPVFNGYVVKITGDSIIFKETFHDRLGKTLTRDVTKSISRPVA